MVCVCGVFVYTCVCACKVLVNATHRIVCVCVCMCAAVKGTPPQIILLDEVHSREFWLKRRQKLKKPTVGLSKDMTTVNANTHTREIDEQTSKDDTACPSHPSGLKGGAKAKHATHISAEGVVAGCSGPAHSHKHSAVRPHMRVPRDVLAKLKHVWNTRPSPRASGSTSPSNRSIPLRVKAALVAGHAQPGTGSPAAAVRGRGSTIAATVTAEPQPLAAECHGSGTAVAKNKDNDTVPAPAAVVGKGEGNTQHIEAHSVSANQMHTRTPVVIGVTPQDNTSSAVLPLDATIGTARGSGNIGAGTSLPLNRSGTDEMQDDMSGGQTRGCVESRPVAYPPPLHVLLETSDGVSSSKELRKETAAGVGAGACSGGKGGKGLLLMYKGGAYGGKMPLTYTHTQGESFTSGDNTYTQVENTDEAQTQREGTHTHTRSDPVIRNDAIRSLEATSLTSSSDDSLDTDRPAEEHPHAHTHTHTHGIRGAKLKASQQVHTQQKRQRTYIQPQPSAGPLTQPDSYLHQPHISGAPLAQFSAGTVPYDPLSSGGGLLQLDPMDSVPPVHTHTQTNSPQQGNFTVWQPHTQSYPGHHHHKQHSHQEPPHLLPRHQEHPYSQQQHQQEYCQQAYQQGIPCTGNTMGEGIDSQYANPEARVHAHSHAHVGHHQVKVYPPNPDQYGLPYQHTHTHGDQGIFGEDSCEGSREDIHPDYFDSSDEYETTLHSDDLPSVQDIYNRPDELYELRLRRLEEKKASRQQQINEEKKIAENQVQLGLYMYLRMCVYV